MMDSRLFMQLAISRLLSIFSSKSGGKKKKQLYGKKTGKKNLLFSFRHYIFAVD